MPYSTPSLRLTNDLIAAGEWNQNTVNNAIALRGGEIALTSQAVGDLVIATSATQLGRVADVATGQVLVSGGVATAPAYSASPSITALTYTTDLKSTTALATPAALSATQATVFASTVSGAAIMGHGTTNDVSLMNRAGTVVLGVGPNTTAVNIPGTLNVAGAITAAPAGNIIPFYFADQAAFPSASSYHGAIAHSHSDGKVYFAHGGSWNEIVDVSSTQTMTNKTVSGVLNGTVGATTANTGAFTTLTVSTALTVPNGGTGVATQQAYGVLVGGTTATGAMQSITPGTSTKVLTSAGTGALPAWSQPSNLTQSFRGLTVRTSPDADLAVANVFLDHADEIVMQDGVSVSDWNDLTANIAVSGAGGLDTGSEGASRWYSIHAIRKSSDGTKNLLLHRAKNYLLDESSTTTGGTTPLRTASSETAMAQTFDTDVTGPGVMADVTLAKVGSPTGQIWLSIYATSAGLPTGAALKTSDKLDVSLISTTAQAIRFIFRDPQTLTAGTTYALAVESTFTISGVNYVNITRSTTDVYAAGQWCAYNGTSWSGSGVDAWFKVYVTENDTALTMPSGYDQYAQVGWVYNDSSSNFTQFRQKDRQYKNADAQVSVVASGSSTIYVLIDASAVVPPVPVVVTNWTVYGDTGAAILSITADLAAIGFAAQNLGVYWSVTPTTTWVRYPSAEVLEGHFYYKISAGITNIGIGTFTW